MANPRSPFLGKGGMHPFIYLSIGFWLYPALQCRSSMSLNCLVFHTLGGISSSPAAFLFLIFLNTESSSSWVKGPSLMSNCLLIILVIGLWVTSWGFSSRFSMLFPQVYLILLAGSFQFSFGSALPSAHFVYCLPYYPRLSIFNRVSNLIDLILYVFYKVVVYLFDKFKSWMKLFALNFHANSSSSSLNYE